MKITKMFSVLALSAVMLASCGPKDADIQTAIKEKAASTPELSNVTVEVKKGIVTLGGMVADEATKTKTEQIVKDIKGVKEVVNNETVAPPVTAPVIAPVIAADDALATGVNTAIKAFPTVAANVANGVVTLTGTISKDNLRKLMMTINSLKPGKVDNRLTVQ